MLTAIVELPRNVKRALMVSTDILAIPFSYWLAFNLRLDFQKLSLNLDDLLVISGTALLTIILFIRTGLYRAVVRYIGSQAMWAIIKGTLVSTLFLTVMSFMAGAFLPRSVPFIYFLLVLVFVGGSRFVARQILVSAQADQRKRVAIYGAGAAGAQALMSLMNSPEYKPVAVVDDDVRLHGRIIKGVTVISREQFFADAESLGVSDVLLAIPSLSRARRKEIIESISEFPVRVHTIPGLNDLVTGKAKIEEFRDIEIEDLLGRDSVEPDQKLLSADITGKVVLVTGAGGSIGSELCRQIVGLAPRKLILLEQSEFALYSIDQGLKSLAQARGYELRVVPTLGSVLDREFLESVVSQFGVQTIYHAAAYKHVPLVEFNVVAGLRVNVFGTLNVAEVADLYGVETCVLVSTDKAVRPTNFMGASKRLAELIFQGMHTHKLGGTRFSMVRFGNVLGSSGSVIPRFRQQITKGGPVTVTHPEIIRYFMTIPEAAQLVIQAGAMSKGGEVFVLDMGEPVRIADLARRMITLMGFTVKDGEHDGDIEIVFTGLRPGEKLYEELLIGENVTPTQHARVSRASEFALDWSQLAVYLKELDRLCEHQACEPIRDLLMRCPIGFSPQGDIEDVLWKQRRSHQTLVLDPAPVPMKAEVVSLKERKELLS